MSLVLSGTDGITFPDTTGPFDGADVESRVKTYLFTETSDINVNVAIASGGVTFGDSTVTAVIPTKGMIGLLFAGALTSVTTTFGSTLGINDGSSTHFVKYEYNGSATYVPFGGAGSGATVGYFGAGAVGPQGWQLLGIEAHGIATGSQTITAKIADNDDASVHICKGSTGTPSPALMYMAIWDFT